MKTIIIKIIAFVLIITLILTGCTLPEKKSSFEDIGEIVEENVTLSAKTDGGREYHLDDTADLEEYRELVYENLVDNIEVEGVFVEDVQVTYYSDEYIRDVLYNSKESVFFGYTLSELDERFGDKKYAFTIGDDGATQVHEFENYDFTMENIIRNVAIGTGVILVCVIVTIATSGAASEATVPCAVVVVNEVAGSMAEAAISTAFVGAAIGGVSAGIVTGLETGDMDAAIKAAALQASKDYMWGAITGAVIGGAAEGISLAYASGGGISVTEAAFIQRNTKLPSSLIRQFKSIDEYYELLEIEKNGGIAVKTVLEISRETNYPIEVVKMFRQTEEGVIYSKQAGLYAREIDGQLALVRDIDLEYKSIYKGSEITNLQRMERGLAPLEPSTGEAYQLHHVGQKIDSPLAILTRAEHQSSENSSILHDSGINSGEGVHAQLSDAEWGAQRENFWKAYAKLFE